MMAMKVLLHLCCGVCGPYPVRTLRAEGHDVQGFWYNPNIHPLVEYRKRLDGVEKFASKSDLLLLTEDDYDLEGFLRAVAFRETERCRPCYAMRLEKAANFAKKGKYDAFTTTLLMSPHQKHELVQEVGQAAGKRYGVEFIYVDMRPGWRENDSAAREMAIYRQQYCGCIYSEEERYRNCQA
ncbi:epoxyqueuosine reductase QueH [Candidatus Hydrogenedentota bacterium]